jgi:hypothetical protein
MPDNEDVTLATAGYRNGGRLYAALPSPQRNGQADPAGAESLMKLNAKRMARGGTSAAFKIRPGDVISVGIDVLANSWRFRETLFSPGRLGRTRRRSSGDTTISF